MFYIRADGNAQTGAGHMMRCLTIAEELKSKTRVTFLCADEASAAMAESLGYTGIVLGKEPFSEEEVSCIADICRRAAEKDLQKNAGDFFLIDSYLATPAYVEAVCKLGKTAYLDDMCRQRFPADFVINYNAFAGAKEYLALYGQEPQSFAEGILRTHATTFLLGNRFIPVRKQFLQKEVLVKEKAEAILITTGGGDKDNLAGAVLEVLLQSEITKGLTMHVVSGVFNPHFEALTNLADRHKNIQVHKNVTDMAGLMRACDIAVTAGGTTVYELCALGVPFVCFSYAANQDALVAFIGEQKTACSAGSMTPGTEESRKRVLTKILQDAERLSQDAEYRKECQKRERKLVDGYGAARIAEVLGCTPLR